MLICDQKNESQLLTINDFQCLTQIDNLNLFKIEKYFQKSEIVKKVSGFVEKVTEEVELIPNGGELN